MNAAANSQYSARAYEQLREDLETLMAAHQLDPQIALDLVDENAFYAASGNQITATLKGKTTGVDTDKFQEGLANAINKELTENQPPSTLESTLPVEEIVLTAGNLYHNHAYFQFGEEFFKTRNALMPWAQKILIVSLGVALIYVIALLFVYSRRHFSLSLINYALLGAVIANLLVAGLLYVKNPMVETTTVLYYKTFIDQYITQSMVPVLAISLIGLIVACTLWAIIRKDHKGG
jgi:hypothetical protein